MGREETGWWSDEAPEEAGRVKLQRGSGRGGGRAGAGAPQVPLELRPQLWLLPVYGWWETGVLLKLKGSEVRLLGLEG